jgi:hypothetical protein
MMPRKEAGRGEGEVLGAATKYLNTSVGLVLCKPLSQYFA